VLLTRAPLYQGRSPFSCDLHVLGAPLTFVLSQDQTLQLNLVSPPRRPRWLVTAIVERSSGSGLEKGVAIGRRREMRRAPRSTPGPTRQSSSRTSRARTMLRAYDSVFKDRGSLRAPTYEGGGKLVKEDAVVKDLCTQ
jgi:hypothetical protein